MTTMAMHPLWRKHVEQLEETRDRCIQMADQIRRDLLKLRLEYEAERLQPRRRKRRSRG